MALSEADRAICEMVVTSALAAGKVAESIRLHQNYQVRLLRHRDELIRELAEIDRAVEMRTYMIELLDIGAIPE